MRYILLLAIMMSLWFSVASAQIVCYTGQINYRIGIRGGACPPYPTPVVVVPGVDCGTGVVNFSTGCTQPMLGGL